MTFSEYGSAFEKVIKRGEKRGKIKNFLKVADEFGLQGWRLDGIDITPKAYILMSQNIHCATLRLSAKDDYWCVLPHGVYGYISHFEPSFRLSFVAAGVVCDYALCAA